MSFFFEEGKATEKHKTQTKKRKIKKKQKDIRQCQSEKAHFTHVNKKKREETHDPTNARTFICSLSLSLSLSSRKRL